jgi:hypothetical protein
VLQARALDGQTPCLDEQARHAELIDEIFTDADAQGRVDLATFKRKVSTAPPKFTPLPYSHT